MGETLVQLGNIHKSYGVGTEVETEVLHGIELVLARGEVAALIGPSGSGKSTLLKLLFRFYDTQGGKVSVDGQDVRGLKQATLREAIGLVPQEVVLFNATMKENLLYGRPGASDAEVEEAEPQVLKLADFKKKAGEGIRTLDVQLGKLAFYH